MGFGGGGGRGEGRERGVCMYKHTSGTSNLVRISSIFSVSVVPPPLVKRTNGILLRMTRWRTGLEKGNSSG